MAEVEILLPKLGESITSAKVLQWFKKVGDTVSEDEPLLEVTTDKVNSEIPSTASGKIAKIVAGNDAEIEVGEILCIVATEGEVVQEKAPEKEKVKEQESGEKVNFISPAVLRLAREKGISMNALEKIKGTGSGGRITKKDVEAYHEPSGGDGDRIKMTGMRKAIADNLVKSFYEAPHASLVTEVDVTDAMNLIKEKKEAFLQKHGYKLTITSFIARAITAAVQEFPLINSSLENDTIVVKRFVNLGIAVSVDQGIFVPVIKNCQSRNIVDIAGAVAQLSKKARGGELKPDDTVGGTITMTNFGMGGTLIGTPIIRNPEVAIVGIGAIHKKVAVLPDDTFGVRQMLYVSLTFDHRVLDGMYGCGFLSALKKHLEEHVEI